MNDITFSILKIVVSIAAALIAVYAVPYLYALKDNEKLALVSSMVETAVLAAEQTIKTGGAAKREEVMRFMTDWLNQKKIAITQEQLSQLLEAAVYELNQAKGA